MCKSSSTATEILKTTDVGGKEGARERKLEWERENDQAGEDSLRCNSGGDSDNPKVAVIHSGKIKQKWAHLRSIIS